MTTTAALTATRGVLRSKSLRYMLRLMRGIQCFLFSSLRRKRTKTLLTHGERVRVSPSLRYARCANCFLPTVCAGPLFRHCLALVVIVNNDNKLYSTRCCCRVKTSAHSGVARRRRKGPKDEECHQSMSETAYHLLVCSLPKNACVVPPKSCIIPSVIKCYRVSVHRRSLLPFATHESALTHQLRPLSPASRMSPFPSCSLASSTCRRDSNTCPTGPR